jgi:HlyD family secretion protein
MSDARHLNTLFSAGTLTGHSDDELLKTFLARRAQAERESGAAEAAFEAIIRRHGPMVLGVCRRYLSDPNDVDDAFQATFIVLFRRAGAVRVGESLGPWLHGVSRRIAARARAVALRRKARETALGVEPAMDPVAEHRLRETSEALDEELDRLPTRYRLPIILCLFEGMTYQEAARRLDCPVGTIGVRLSRGRELLRERLTRRGSFAPAGIFLTAGRGTATMSAAVPPALLDATLRVVLHGVECGAKTKGMVAASAISLAEGLLRSMLMTSVKTAAFALLSAVLVVTGGGVLLRPAAARLGGKQGVQSRDVVKQGAPGVDATRSSPTSNTAQRIRELIYFFRTYRPSVRDEEWANPPCPSW